MNRRVLLVDPEATYEHEVALALGDGFQLFGVRNAREALAACKASGPFSVVISTSRTEGMSGIELLSEVRRLWPDSRRLFIAEDPAIGIVLEAIQHGAVFRCLTPPLALGVLDEAIEAAVRDFHGVEEERLLTEQLQFAQESLRALTRTLERRLASQLARLSGLQEFSEELGNVSHLEEVARLLARTASRLLGGRGVEVVLANTRGRDDVTAHGGPILNEDEQPRMEAIYTDEGDVGYLRLDAHSPKGEGWHLADVGVLKSLASLTGLAYHKHIHRHERDTAQHATIYALARLAENRDDETGRHLQRVSEYCRTLARGLRAAGHYTEVLTDAWIEDLARSAPLHDIGKVGIPDAILLKPGPLTAEEWQVMRTHTTIGAETLRRVLEDSGEQGFLRMGYEIAWCHHEKWDGSGYPRGLVGDEIPLVARIVALADCYDALTTRRPYKQAWSHARASEEVRKSNGSHFDPRLVDVFLAEERQFDLIRGRLTDD